MAAGDPSDFPAGADSRARPRGPDADSHANADSQENADPHANADPQENADTHSNVDTHSSMRGAARRGLFSRLRPVLIGGLILGLGLGTSVFLAEEWRTSAQHANRQSFTAEATDLGSTLQSKLSTTIGLTRMMRAIATMEPTAGRDALSRVVSAAAARCPRSARRRSPF